MCQTSEKGEKLFSRREMLPIALEIGRRILEVFGYQQISNIVFRLKSNRQEINSVINGEKLPATELLLGIQKETGVSLDWLLTGEGSKFLALQPVQAESQITMSRPLRKSYGFNREVFRA